MLEKLTVQEFDDDKLVINNVEIAGWIDDDKCRFSKAQRCYSERFDDYFAHTAIVGQSLAAVTQTADSARTDLIFQINFGKKAKKSS